MAATKRVQGRSLSGAAGNRPVCEVSTKQERMRRTANVGVGHADLLLTYDHTTLRCHITWSFLRDVAVI